jgi:hypothetical protein
MSSALSMSISVGKVTICGDDQRRDGALVDVPGDRG